jgi:hypothetical protein
MNASGAADEGLPPQVALAILSGLLAMVFVHGFVIARCGDPLWVLLQVWAMVLAVILAAMEFFGNEPAEKFGLMVFGALMCAISTMGFGFATFCCPRHKSRRSVV